VVLPAARRRPRSPHLDGAALRLIRNLTRLYCAALPALVRPLPRRGARALPGRSQREE